TCYLFFFQAEDGIRDRNVTGVQTCALPICYYFHHLKRCQKYRTQDSIFTSIRVDARINCIQYASHTTDKDNDRKARKHQQNLLRSEERRVGKEGRYVLGPGKDEERV